MKKFPPIEKVYEAWTALADHRVKMHEGYADVSSSDGEKSYVVRFSGDQYSSDDNATYWQGYPGYPVIAVLMLQGKLPYDKEESELWKNINWTQLNKSHKNKYAEAVKEVADERGINLEHSMSQAEEVMSALSQLPLVIKRKLKI
ncbi:MAG: hypothetical protein J1F67_08150 [Muribaculaceae bacterium]|nr:hypothetical protein [Muribaculaceae bacterium]